MSRRKVLLEYGRVVLVIVAIVLVIKLVRILLAQWGL